MSDKKKRKITIPSYGGGRVSIEGLNDEEVELIIGSILGGHSWIRKSEDGSLEKVSSYEPLPESRPDEGMISFWPKKQEVSGQGDLSFVIDNEELMKNVICPSINIGSLCGYNYSKENYEIQKGKLESYGFVQMRSQRGQNGQYWETWYLPSLWSAEGDLKEHLKGDRGNIDKAISFLCKNASFGTLDVVAQRAAMVID